MQDESQELSIGAAADHSQGKAAVNGRAESQKLSIMEKVGFSLGDAASNIFFQTFILFITIFYMTGVSTQRAGVAATSVASKMSLVLTVAVAVLFLFYFLAEALLVFVQIARNTQVTKEVALQYDRRNAGVRG